MTSEELDARFARFGEDVREAILSSGAESRRHAEELAARNRRHAEEYAEALVERSRRQNREHAEELIERSRQQNRQYSDELAERARQYSDALAERNRQHAEDLAARARQYADELVERSREHAERSRRETATQIADNRHFFQVIAEDLVAKIQLVAEGVTTVDQKLDRFRDEVRGEFVVVGRRLDRLESRVARLETPA